MIAVMVDTVVIECNSDLKLKSNSAMTMKWKGMAHM
jgi:hypothetical protein